MPDAAATVRAAGGVVWRPAGDDVEVLVVHRPRYDDWSLPKGKLLAGEPAVVGAVREVGEETGADVVVGRTLGTTRYPVLLDGHEVPKSVRWWAMRATGGRFSPNDEVDAVRWLRPADAVELLSRAGEREPLERLTGGPLRTRTLLAVRHARAGSRAAWHGDDVDRPLDDRGAAQAAALARLLEHYRPVRLLSAPLERCTATLRPLAARLGVQVVTDEALAGRSWAKAPDRTLALLRDVVADGRAAVVCSQGEVLPPALQSLADSLVGTEPRTPKGSVWALSFDDRCGPVDADFVAPPA